MDRWDELMKELSLDEAKSLLLHLAKEIFSILTADEKQKFVVEMAGQTGKDKIGSMVQL